MLLRKITAMMLGLILLVLCACGQVMPEETNTTTTTVATTTEITTTTIAPTTVELKTSKDDPYSYVANAYYLYAQDMQFYNNDIDSQQPEKILAKDFNMLPENGFAYLERFMLLEQMRDLQYALYDINGDGKKELLLGAKDSYSTELFDIYALQNGIAVQQRISGFAHSRFSVLQNGTVMSTGGHQGYYGDSYYRFKNGNLEHQATLSFSDINVRINEQTGEEEYFEVHFKNYTDDYQQREQISKKEYDRIQKQYADSPEVEIDWKPLAEYTA